MAHTIMHYQFLKEYVETKIMLITLEAKILPYAQKVDHILENVPSTGLDLCENVICLVI